MQLAKTLLLICHLAVAGAFLFAVPEHVWDESWPAHARNHALQALFWVVGFNVVSIYLIVKRIEYNFVPLLLSGIFILGGYFLAIPITGGAAPGMTHYVFFGTVSLVYLFAILRLRNAVKNNYIGLRK